MKNLHVMLLYGLWAVLLTIWAPFRGIFRLIFSLFFCKPKRSMENEIVLVTGSGRGLGRGICIEMARLGATVVCWDINEIGNMETVEMASKVSPRRGSVHAYRCDVSSREDVMAVAERVKAEVGNITMLINNAGIITAGRLETYKPEEIIRVVNVNFISHFWTIGAFLPHMKSINSGQIVCLSSMAALTPTEFMIPYSSTKSAVTGLMDSLEEELLCSHHDKIQVTTVHPFFANSSPTMGQFDKKGDGPDLMELDGVVSKIVSGVLEKERDFTIPGSLLPLTKFAKIFPRYVLRSYKRILMGKWNNTFQESTSPIIVK